MSTEKVVFAFFVILALSLNLSFFSAGVMMPDAFHSIELYAALVSSLICTVLKFGDRTSFGSAMLASSLVVDVLLIAAAMVAGFSGSDGNGHIAVFSLSCGALIANAFSVVLLIIETSQLRK